MIKNISILLLFYIILSNSLLLNIQYAQSPDTMWTKTLGGDSLDEAMCVQQTNDGGYIIVGFTSSFGTGDNDVWLIKTNDFGDTLWTKTFGGTYRDYGSTVQQTSDRGYIIIGSTMSFDTMYYDVWLIKTDDSGDTLWTKTFGGSRHDIGCYVEQTTDEGYILTGYTNSFGLGGYDALLIKTDKYGNTLWTKTFGENNDDFVLSAQQTSDSGFILTGHKYYHSARPHDTWLIKTDASGDTLWTRTFARNGSDMGKSVQQTNDGGYIVTGSAESFGAGKSDIWLIKTNSLGHTLWTKTFGGSESDGGYSVQQTTDGYIILGQTKSFGAGNYDVWLIKTDDYGDTLWTKTYGGTSDDAGYFVQQTNDGGYIITGYTGSFGAGNRDIWIIRIASDPSNIKNDNHYPYLISLEQNYPNPFNPTTTIEFSVPKTELVTLKIYNLLGQEVATLVSEKLNAGNYNYSWDAGFLANGVYIYKLQAGAFTQVHKMIYLK